MERPKDFVSLSDCDKLKHMEALIQMRLKLLLLLQFLTDLKKKEKDFQRRIIKHHKRFEKIMSRIMNREPHEI